MTFGTMEKIETVTVGSGGQAAIEFTNIPATYDDLLVKISTREATGTSSTLRFRINGITTSTYSGRYIQGSGSGTPSSGAVTTTSGEAGVISSSTDTASTFGSVDFYIPNYRSSNNKSISSDSVSENNATTAYSRLTASLWSNTAAITSLSFYVASGNLAQHSTATLYGITRVPAGAKATGGVIYDDDSYWYHVFTSSGTFTPSQNLTCDVLVVAGGGSARTDAGGGGGAGGLVGHTNQSLTATNYTVTVGAGGSASNGSNSQFGSLTASVGGGRAGSFAGAASTGGSGGGGGMTGNTSGAAGTSGQGFAGGNGTAGAAGGGGGAGAVGAAGGTNGGDGGIGVSTYSSWGLATNTGQNVSGTVYYAGGGGGSKRTSGNPGVGGLGGGGNGNFYTTDNGTNGAAFTGGGAGGSDFGSEYKGGSGIVIVRYAK